MALCQRFTLKFQISMPVPTYSHQIQLWYPTPSPRRRILEPRRPLLFPSSAEMEERKPTTVSPNNPCAKNSYRPLTKTTRKKRTRRDLSSLLPLLVPKQRNPTIFAPWPLRAHLPTMSIKTRNQLSTSSTKILFPVQEAILKQYRQLEFNWECLMSYQEPNLPNIWYSDVVQRNIMHFLPQIVSDQYIFILPRN